MTTEELCQELLMTDVVRIDFVKRSAWSLPVPFNVADQSQMTVTDYAASALLLVIDYRGDGDAIMSESPSHRVTEAREVAGIIKTHTLQIPIDNGFQAIRSKKAALLQDDFYIVLYTVDGTRFLAYTMPNTSQFAIDEQMGSSATMTVKATVKSMSGMIKLTITS